MMAILICIIHVDHAIRTLTTWKEMCLIPAKFAVTSPNLSVLFCGLRNNFGFLSCTFGILC